MVVMSVITGIVLLDILFSDLLKKTGNESGALLVDRITFLIIFAIFMMLFKELTNAGNDLVSGADTSIYREPLSGFFTDLFKK